MFPFGPRQRPRHLLRILALLTGFFGGTLRAKVTDYAADPLLSVTTVNLGKLNLRPISLAEIFTVIETETSLKLAYATGTFSLGEEIVLATDGVISLAQLFGMVSAQKDLEFVRDGGQVAVRGTTNSSAPRGQQIATTNLPAASESPSVRSMAVAASVPAARSGPSAGAASAELAATVGAIAGDDQSRSRREKRIGTAVSAAMVSATAGLEAKADVLEVAVELAGAAAGAAPAFADTIANAAAFAAPIKSIKGAAARLRSAAFSAARSPKSAVAATRSASAARVESAPAAKRSGVIRVPAGQTPDSFQFQPTPEPTRSETTSSAAPTLGANSSNFSAASSTESASAPAASSAPANSAFGTDTTSSLGPINLAPIELPPAAPAANADGVIKMEKFGVAESVTKSSTRGLKFERIQTTAAIDTLGAADLKKFVSNDVSSVLIRLPGVSMASSGGASFAVIRGLSERYSPVLLDGMSLPSPDPERQSPQVDIFPTRLMEALVVYKTFEARLPGTGTGGTIDLRTQGVPEGRFGEVQVGLRFDEGFFSNSRYLTYSTAGNKDLLALGKSDRAARGSLDPAVWTNVAGRVNSPLAARQTSLPPGYQFAAAFGDVVPIGTNGREFGFGLNLTYNSTYSTDESLKFGYNLSVGDAAKGKATSFPASTIRPSIESSERVAVAGALVAGFKLSPDHRFFTSILLSQTGDDTAEVKGPSNSVGDDPPLQHDLHYKQRHFLNSRIGGVHTFSGLGDFKADWVFGGTRVAQDEPDYRYMALAPQPGGLFFLFGTGSPEPRPTTRFWRSGQEDQRFGRVDFSKTLADGFLQAANFKWGVSVNRVDRDYSDQAYSFGVRGSNPPKLSGNLQTLGAEIISFPSGVTAFNDYSGATASGKRNIDALHAQFTLPFLSERIKWTAGLRAEHLNLGSTGKSYYSILTPYELYVNKETNVDAGPLAGAGNRTYVGKIDERNYLPTTSLTWTPRKSLNLRLAAFKTVALPSSRELGAYYTFDPITEVLQLGNVGLKPSSATSYDARIEWFGKGSDLLAVSAFYKQIKQPIEKFTYRLSVETVTWLNHPGEAKLSGAEFEFRKNLGFLAEPLASVTVGGNVTWIQAEVPVTKFEFLGSKDVFPAGKFTKRRLYDQPEFLGNADITWSLPRHGFSTALTFNYSGDSLYALRDYIYNLYRDSYYQVDWTMSQTFGRAWTLRLSAKNLTDSDRDYILDPTATSERYVYRSGKNGRSYSLSLLRSF